MKKSNGFKTPSWTSPKGGSRGCLCEDNRYSVECCDGSLQAQGIGLIYRKGETFYLLLENGGFIKQENESLIKLENG